jgi:RimJ/RimL family protein N-acetyltransferase
MEPADAAALHARRSDPEVARHQDWVLPYTIEQAKGLVAEMAAQPGPGDDGWWMATVCQAGGEPIGDLAVGSSSQGRTAEIGFTFDRAHWGSGYAVEAVGALLDWLFDEKAITRASAMTHPDNRASAVVLERTGFLFEGHTKQSCWVGDEVSDDWLFGVVSADRTLWNSRPTQPPGEIRLVEVTTENERDVYQLKTHKTQEEFVAPMSASYADALFPEVVEGAPVVPWLRAVAADGEIVGFVMLALTTEHHPEPYLWRLLIDRLHQRRGIGKRVLDLIGEECRAKGDATLLTSWVEGKGSPAPFYLQYGFRPTGEIVDEETEARLSLA